MHALLKRQIKRFFGAAEALPEALKPLCAAVSAAYEQNDMDRAMIERSLDIMSQELMEQNRALSSELKAHKTTAEQLTHSLSILDTTMNSTIDGLLMIGNDNQIEGFNDRFLEIWGVSRRRLDDRKNAPVREAVARQLKDPEKFLLRVAKLTASDDTSLDLIEFNDGRVLERFTTPRLMGREKAGRVWIFRDITDRHRAEQKLVYLANHDELTGLANRNLLQDRLQQSIATAHRHGESMAVLFLDLDQFKFINDSLGHGAGDELLKAVAERLKDCVRESDTVARNGGDEFVLLLNELAGPHAAAETAAPHPLIVDSLQRILDAISRPVIIAEQEISITCSIGACLYPDDAKDAETLLKNADAAMYRAKELGRNNFQFYTAELNALSGERLELQTSLRRALQRGEFSLHYQPKINLASGRLSGVEALLRWNNRVLGPVPPDRFIPILEQTGMIIEVGRWVMTQAAADQARWQAAGLALRIAVNVSQLQLEQKNFVALVEEAVKVDTTGDIGIDIEITESLIMKNIEINIAKLRTIREMRMRIAIDDFGTGYSSLSYLAKLPVNSLKIDRAFIDTLTSSKDNLTIVTTMISLAHSLNLSVIAEGVETEAQATLLHQLGCDEIQGYFISPALPAESFLAWCSAYSPLPFGESASYSI